MPEGAALRADVRIQSERNGRRKIAEQEGAAGQDGTAKHIMLANMRAKGKSTFKDEATNKE